MADPRITMPIVITVSPETLAYLDRLVAELAALTAALAARPVADVAAPDVADGVPRTWAQTAAVQRASAEPVPAVFAVCRTEVYRVGDPAYYLCTREDGHAAAEYDAGHVAEVDGKVLACSTCTGLGRRTTDMVCETCGTDYAKEA